MNHRPFRLIAPAVALSCLFALAGCSQTSTTTSSPAPSASSTTRPAPAGSFKVALLTTGPVTDHGWNEAAYDGLKKIQSDLGAQISNQETDNPSQFASAFQGYASQGYNLIIAHGDEYSDTAKKIAAQYPKTDFVTTGGDNSAPNLAPIVFATEQGTYIQGMEAAFVSKSGKGGFVGGQDLPPVTRAVDAFQSGAKAVKPSFSLAATYINSWNDTQKAKAQTEALMSQGADVIAHNCDAAAQGLFQAASKPGVYTFGVNANQNDQAPNVLSSAILDIPKAFTDVAKSVQNGTFKGEPLYLGMKEGDVLVVDNPKFASLYTPAQKAQIQKAEQDIISGKIDLKPKTL
ncbi:MAG TPA: BMP family protein [Capsulimonadaceae bacterium]|nr:BMP family protein [Capsulimonadaceae bacterium]